MLSFPDYTILDYTVLDYTILDYTVLDYTVLDYTILHYIVLNTCMCWWRKRISEYKTHYNEYNVSICSEW